MCSVVERTADGKQTPVLEMDLASMVRALRTRGAAEYQMLADDLTHQMTPQPV